MAAEPPETDSDPCPQCGHEVGDAWLVCAWCGQQLAAPAELSEGTRLAGGRYRIDRVIGRGGFGITYGAVDQRLERSVAVKELFPESAVRHGSVVLTPPAGRPGFKAARERFLREARVLARFTHPGIVRVFEVFEEHGTAYLVMELLEGRTLIDLLRQHARPFGEEDVLDVAGRVAAALRPVHAAGVLHRDVNPSNVMMTHHGRIVVIDFGLARDFDQDRTAGMTRVVTPGYAPLEQYRGEGRFGPATDVYGLAATLYRLSTGKVPVAALERSAGAPLAPPHRINPEVSKSFSDALLDGLELEPSHRPQDLDSFLSRLGVARLPEGPRARLLDTVPVVVGDGTSVTTALPPSSDASMASPIGGSPIVGGSAMGRAVGPEIPVVGGAGAAVDLPELSPVDGGVGVEVGGDSRGSASVRSADHRAVGSGRGPDGVDRRGPGDGGEVRPGAEVVDPIVDERSGDHTVVDPAYAARPVHEVASAAPIEPLAGDHRDGPVSDGTRVLPSSHGAAGRPSTSTSGATRSAGVAPTEGASDGWGLAAGRGRSATASPGPTVSPGDVDRTVAAPRSALHLPVGLPQHGPGDLTSSGAPSSVPVPPGPRGHDPRPSMAFGPHRPGRRRLTVPLAAVAIAFGAAAPVLTGALLVLVVLPWLATYGDSVAHRLRAQHGVAGGWAERRAGPGALAPVRFVRNVVVAVLRTSPIVGVGAVALAGWYGLESIDPPRGLLHMALRVIGATVAALLVLTSREGSHRFRTGLGLDELVARLVPGGRTNERVVVLWLLAGALSAGALWLTPSTFPLP